MPNTGRNEPSVNDDLLVRFQAGDPAAREKFPASVRNQLLREARRLAPGLAQHGLADDIVQTMWLNQLVVPSGHFDPQRSSAMTYLHLQLRSAVKAVGAEHRRGRPTRRVHDDLLDDDIFEPRVLSLGDIGAPDGFGDMSSEAMLADVRSEDAYGHVLDRVDVEHIMRLAASTASTPVLIALCAIQDGATMSAAGVRVGLSRFALRRAIDSWVEAQSITR